MTAVDNSLLRPEPKRDRWGRYLIKPAAGGRAVGHTRVTTFAKSVADTHNLTEWAKRNVALGMAKRQDLQAKAFGLTHDDKATLQEVVAEAEEASGASERRNLGTALHRMCEQVDLGQLQLEQIPPAQRDDVAAYVEVMRSSGVEVVADYVERVCVVAEHTLAGTFDRLVRIDGRLVVADLKTGQEISYGAGEIAIQLASYANASTLYDTADETHSPMPEVDRTRGLIIHLPAGEARCSLHWVDLTAGWEACRLAAEVRAWRKRRDLLTVFSPASAPPVATAPAEAAEPTPLELRAEWVRDRVKACVEFSDQAKADLGRLWPEGVATFGAVREGKAPAHTDAELDRIIELLTQLMQMHDLPLFPPDPTLPKPAAKPAARVLDEGPTVTLDVINDLRVRSLALDPVALEAMNRWGKEAYDARCSFSAKDNHTERRVAIVDAAIFCAAWDPSGDAVREALGIVMGEIVQPSVPVGVAFGHLTTAEAIRLKEVARTLLEQPGALSFDESGRPKLAVA